MSSSIVSWLQYVQQRHILDCFRCLRLFISILRNQSWVCVLSYPRACLCACLRVCVLVCECAYTCMSFCMYVSLCIRVQYVNARNINSLTKIEIQKEYIKSNKEIYFFPPFDMAKGEKYKYTHTHASGKSSAFRDQSHQRTKELMEVKSFSRSQPLHRMEFASYT